jgi:hypothetical protein
LLYHEASVKNAQPIVFVEAKKGGDKWLFNFDDEL